MPNSALDTEKNHKILGRGYQLGDIQYGNRGLFFPYF